MSEATPGTSETRQAPVAPGGFAPTHWTVVLRARGDAPEAREALSQLCEAYWTPVFRFLRSEGRDEETARDLTQEFFARLLAGRGLAAVDPARGRFRSYLLGAVKHFLRDQRLRQNRLKRGGSVAPESLEAPNGDTTAPRLEVPDPAGFPPDTLFDRAWAMAVMDRALAALGAEFDHAGKTAQFDTLKPWLVGEAPGFSQAQAAQALGLNEGAVKVAIHRLRRRFRDLVRVELAQTVGSLEEVDGELRYLVEVLSDST